MKTISITVEGMSCSACAARVEKALTCIDGVSGAAVNLAESSARVEFASSKLSPDRLVAAINGLGYRAVSSVEVR